MNNPFRCKPKYSPSIPAKEQEEAAEQMTDSWSTNSEADSGEDVDQGPVESVRCEASAGSELRGDMLEFSYKVYDCFRPSACSTPFEDLQQQHPPETASEEAAVKGIPRHSSSFRQNRDSAALASEIWKTCTAAFASNQENTQKLPCDLPFESAASSSRDSRTMLVDSVDPKTGSEESCNTYCPHVPSDDIPFQNSSTVGPNSSNVHALLERATSEVSASNVRKKYHKASSQQSAPSDGSAFEIASVRSTIEKESPNLSKVTSLKPKNEKNSNLSSNPESTSKRPENISEVTPEKEISPRQMAISKTISKTSLEVSKAANRKVSEAPKRKIRNKSLLSTAVSDSHGETSKKSRDIAVHNQSLVYDGPSDELMPSVDVPLPAPRGKSSKQLKVKKTEKKGNKSNSKSKLIQSEKLERYADPDNICPLSNFMGETFPKDITSYDLGEASMLYYINKAVKQYQERLALPIKTLDDC